MRQEGSKRVGVAAWRGHEFRDGYGDVANNDFRASEPITERFAVHGEVARPPHIRHISIVPGLRQARTEVKSEDVDLDAEQLLDSSRVTLKSQQSAPSGHPHLDH